MQVQSQAPTEQHADAAIVTNDFGFSPYSPRPCSAKTSWHSSFPDLFTRRMRVMSLTRTQFVKLISCSCAPAPSMRCRTPLSDILKGKQTARNLSKMCKRPLFLSLNRLPLQAMLYHQRYRCINEKRSAWTCWRSGVKFSHRTTTGRWRSYDRTNSLRTPTMKESQLLREKTTSPFNMSKPCACPVSLTCIHTQHQAMWRRLLAVETLPIDRNTGEDLRARSIAIKVKHETLPANRTRLLAAPVATASRSTGMRHAVGAAMAIVLKISTVIIWS